MGSLNQLGSFEFDTYALYTAYLLGMFVSGNPQGENTFITFTDQSLVLTTIRTPLLLRAWQRLTDARWITKPSPTFAPRPFGGSSKMGKLPAQ